MNTFKVLVRVLLIRRLCMHACKVASVVSDSVQSHGQQPTRLLCPLDSRQEYWSGLPCPPPGDLPDLGIEPVSLMSPALAGGFTTSHLGSPFLA